MGRGLRRIRLGETLYPQRNPLAEASALSWRRCSLLLEAAAVSQLIPLSVTCHLPPVPSQPHEGCAAASAPSSPVPPRPV